MKKKVFTVILCLAIIISLSPDFQVCAIDDYVNKTACTTYLPDGSYYITTIEEYPIALMSSQQQKAEVKTVAGYNNKGKKQYSLTVKGVFTFDGNTSKAVSASYEFTTEAFWSFSDGSTKCSGNTATATGTFKYLMFFQATTVTVSLSCSPTGVLS